MTQIIITGNGKGRYQQEVKIGQHQLLADEPESLGGDDAGPSPMEFVLTGLGACTAITLRMYAEKKGLDIARITVSLEHRRSPEGKHQVERVVAVEGNLTDEQRTRLLEIANRCPTHLALQQPLEVKTRLEPAV
ncbi:MAG: OsmC-like protein [Betaproteobacteria bacterium ADurb.Bin341]|nr:MAG: OsmC-like protein [Betaproteobacteria bacterium ADurb.Bin341]